MRDEERTGSGVGIALALSMAPAQHPTGGAAREFQFSYNPSFQEFKVGDIC
jgi:hypothetical protein